MEKIGIGVTTYNRNRLVGRTVEQIKKFTDGPFKLVVVDDGSKVPVQGATFRFQFNQGSPVSKNKCLELLDDCEHVFLFDDDTYPIKKGWQDLYLENPYGHLNYTFKYPGENANGTRLLSNPNGCMMYYHRPVIDHVGGFDTGFIKYGYWHAAYSNRVFNAGLIPHPFMDVENSSEYIYCLDQKRTAHRTSTPNRGQYLAQNKKRYEEKLLSDEYIEYKRALSNVRIRYSNPFSVEKNIGKEYNEFCEDVKGDDTWICLQDGDMSYLTGTWGKQIHDVVSTHGEEISLFGCMTNRIGRNIQREPGMFDVHDMRDHSSKALEIEKHRWGKVEDITDKKYVAGFLMLFPKRLWLDVKFPENNIAFDDAFSLGAIKKGHRIGLMKGLYVYHLYRLWSDNPVRDRAHLK